VVESSGILVSEVTEHAGEPVDLLVQRGEEELSLSMVPRSPGEFDPEVDGPIGISLGYTSGSRLSRGPIESATASLRSIWDIMYLTVRAPIMLIEGQITAEQARPVGPVGISQIAGETARYTATTGDWFQLLRITAFISVALGFTNLLPIPALDGGRIVFVLIEAVRGRRIEPEREGLVHLVGMLFLLGLMFLLIIQDIANPIIQ
ncbi:MAG: site-2 protease family protein, partial [Chloroflexota bacterium]